MNQLSPIRHYYVSEHVTLDRGEVLAALSSAVLARADELARFGEPRVRALTLEARVSASGEVDIVGVAATLEARLDPAIIALLSGNVPLSTPSASDPADNPAHRVSHASQAERLPMHDET